MIKRARFTDEQIVRILQGADRAPVAEVAKRYVVSEPSIYAWRTAVGLVFVRLKPTYGWLNQWA